MNQARSPEPRNERPELVVGFVFGADFTLTPLAAFVDALRLAADHDDESRQIHCGWSFLSHDLQPMRASCGLEVVPTTVYGDPRDFDYVIVVGGRTRATRDCLPSTIAYLRAAAGAKVPLVGLCTGGLLLAEAGLMKNRRCCIHFAVMKEFVSRYPDSIPVTDANFVLDGDIITCPGSIAAFDVATYLIDRHCSQVRAKKAQNYLLMGPGQPRLYLPERPYEDKLVNAHRATVDSVRIMEMNIDRPFPVSRVAEMVNVTPSRLARLFHADLETTPAAFWRDIRLAQARHLLVDSSRSITEVAYETGFSDSAHFCNVFRRAYNTTPHGYREKAR